MTNTLSKQINDNYLINNVNQFSMTPRPATNEGLFHFNGL